MMPLSRMPSSSYGFDEMVVIGLRAPNAPRMHDTEGGTGAVRDGGGLVAELARDGRES
jgi:hypothetical protein